MSSKYKEDYEFGLNNENDIKPIIENHFNTKLTKLTQYHQMDWEDDNCFYELKSRNNEYLKYPTTMIGSNKIEYINKSNKQGIFLFKFIDGIYYLKYDKNLKLDKKIGGRKDRGKYEYKQYIYIPIEYLTKIN